MKSHRKPGTWTFFRQWLKNPLRVAAVAPSSAELAAAMIAELPDDVERVIELGGGTGAITRALLDAGVRDEDLLVLELNEELHAHLHMRFPRVPVLLGDARLLPELAREQGYLDAGKADAIVSGLGLLTMPHPLQRDILGAAFECLREDGVFVQFTYGPAAPVADAVARSLRLQVRRGDFVLRNVPPATVYVYSRMRR
ncbi:MULTISPECIES: methyltransferase domain-containing protein [unclassified Lysobacter]|uniref:class I SAM-dependent methyltransferase n=1 Tax=unclassified Lysobacter TaxID=2635362 RepID=UPI001BE91FDA|nr:MULTISPECIES: methyltransferase domain-containing protein [unclassified Lysobacter]MBT2748942.1 methyltransferase domain-containing protein [Lysobacter sp. ISL-42]MBT2751320.1 methyltransferase domain-containing protein [Lysobacter sp. ISL-50]MBT2776525.1 methyltransferase domain-containing protein [Lysobacter sp. ISL-54]MBT2781019.1 methyltransferase domain-containing protein [Lysobacter sp. ISL-52]